jgi:hypothetical protein
MISTSPMKTSVDPDRCEELAIWTRLAVHRNIRLYTSTFEGKDDGGSKSVLNLNLGDAPS